jgi:hypothetical protein
VIVLTTSNIYCIWYPSGGFGHYINAILSIYGKGFARPQQQPIFSADGNSHALDTIAPIYFHNPKTYQFEFNPDLKYTVLIDNGINNEGTTFQKHFPNANTIKMCYSDFSWPIVAHTMIVKAMNSDFESELSADTDAWNLNEPWVQREKYFLFLRDHMLRYQWRPDLVSTAIMIEDLLDYKMLTKKINVEIEDFELFWQQWKHANQQYFDPVLTAQKILNGDFELVTDIWTQAVVYYQIWCKYGIEVPHNEYSNWFTNYDDIVKLLHDHGVYH